MAAESPKSPYKKQDDGAVINTSDAELQAYMSARSQLLAKKEQDKKLSDLENKVESLDAKLQVILDHITNQAGK